MPEDLRTIKSKKAIRKAFLDLLQDKPFEEVTITEITRRAECNRNTFYAHYEDKYDLAVQICDKSLQELDNALSGMLTRHFRTSEEKYLAVSQICLDKMAEDMDFYTVMLGKNRMPAFADRYRQTIIRFIFADLPDKKKSDKGKILETEFSTNGLIAIHRYWLLHQEKYTKQDILETLKNLVVGLGKIIFEGKP